MRFIIKTEACFLFKILCMIVQVEIRHFLLSILNKETIFLYLRWCRVGDLIQIINSSDHRKVRSAKILAFIAVRHGVVGQVTTGLVGQVATYVCKSFVVQTFPWLLEFVIHNKSRAGDYSSLKPNSKLKHFSFFLCFH